MMMMMREENGRGEARARARSTRVIDVSSARRFVERIVI